MTTSRDLQTEWAHLVMRAFVDCGIRDVVVSPGGRIVPFVLPLANDARVRMHSVIDERAAAFFALGQARVTGAPTLLLCTSGTASAHYLPAVIEARSSLTPLVVVTADRAAESHHGSAQQTIDQSPMFAGQALAYYDLGAADPWPPLVRATRRLVAQAVGLARGPHPGPVHLNVRARMPVVPTTPHSEFEAAAVARVVELSRRSLLKVTSARLAPEAAPLRALAQRMATEPAGVIAIGPEPPGPVDEAMAAAIARLAQRTGYPILREPTSSGPRSGERQVVSGAVPLLLSSPRVRRTLQPTLVLQIGFELVHPAYHALIGELAQGRLEILSSRLEIDAESRAGVVHHGEPAMAVEILNAELDRLGVARGTSDWFERWRSRCDVAAGAVAAAVQSPSDDHEVAMVAAFVQGVQSAPQSPLLIVGNSLPVRELDLVSGWVPLPTLRCLHQRGGAGIEGMCAGAAGVASVAGPTALLIGDVTLLHDLHGLYLAGRASAPLTVAVVVNGGGKIFDQSTGGNDPAMAEAKTHWTTPIDVDLASLARFARGRHVRVDRAQDVSAAVHGALAQPGLTLLELRVAPDSAAELARTHTTTVESALQAAQLMSAAPV